MNPTFQYSLSIIIPCKNEESAIAEVIDRYQKARRRIQIEIGISEIELIVVDDHSTDRSYPFLLQSAEPCKDHCRIARLHQGSGYGASLKAGFRLAKGDLLAFYDMDCTYDPLDLILLIQTLLTHSLDMVVGNRLSEVSPNSKMPWTRKIGNLVFVKLIRKLFQMDITDCCSGIRVFRRKNLEQVTSLPDKLDFALAMTLLFIRNQIPFAEVPVSYFRRTGKSKLNLMLDGLVFLYRILSAGLERRIISENMAQISGHGGLKAWKTAQCDRTVGSENPQSF